MYTKYWLVTTITVLFFICFLPQQVYGDLVAQEKAVLSSSYSSLPEKEYGSNAGDSLQKSEGYVEHEKEEKMFCFSILDYPRANNDLLLSHFSYAEIPVYEFPEDSLSIILFNGYALADIANPEDLNIDFDYYNVASVDIVFTKYPYHKEDWRTNYYDLLSWRLLALFELDSLLNNDATEWGLILQTDGKTDYDARQMYHGIVLRLVPREKFVATIEIPEEKIPQRDVPSPIENGGFLLRQDRNPDYFRSRLIFEPEPGQEPRRNMDPSKLRCPTWR